jgi:hypothetical protein
MDENQDDPDIRELNKRFQEYIEVLALSQTARRKAPTDLYSWKELFNRNEFEHLGDKDKTKTITEQLVAASQTIRDESTDVIGPVGGDNWRNNLYTARDHTEAVNTEAVIQKYRTEIDDVRDRIRQSFQTTSGASFVQITKSDLEATPGLAQDALAEGVAIDTVLGTYNGPDSLYLRILSNSGTDVGLGSDALDKYTKNGNQIYDLMDEVSLFKIMMTLVARVKIEENTQRLHNPDELAQFDIEYLQNIITVLEFNIESLRIFNLVIALQATDEFATEAFTTLHKKITTGSFHNTSFENIAGQPESPVTGSNRALFTVSDAEDSETEDDPDNPKPVENNTPQGDSVQVEVNGPLPSAPKSHLFESSSKPSPTEMYNAYRSATLKVLIRKSGDSSKSRFTRLEEAFIASFNAGQQKTVVVAHIQTQLSHQPALAEAITSNTIMSFLTFLCSDKSGVNGNQHIYGHDATSLLAHMHSELLVSTGMDLEMLPVRWPDNGPKLVQKWINDTAVGADATSTMPLDWPAVGAATAAGAEAAAAPLPRPVSVDVDWDNAATFAKEYLAGQQAEVERVKKELRRIQTMMSQSSNDGNTTVGAGVMSTMA